MAISTITFQSNLTATTAGGSTVTSASTSKVFSTSEATADVQTLLTQSIPTGTAATAVDVGAVDLTRSHAIRFRNTSTNANIVVAVIGTIAATDRILGFMRAGCAYGPQEHPGSGFAFSGSGTSGTAYPSVSAGPTAYKLFAYTLDNVNPASAAGTFAIVEVEVVQTGSLVTTAPGGVSNVNGNLVG